MTAVDTKEKEKETVVVDKPEAPVTLGELQRDGQNLNQRFIKALDVMCAAGVDIEHTVLDKAGEPDPKFPLKFRFSPLTYGDLAEMTQRRKAASLQLYRAEVYDHTVMAKQRFEDLHAILHRTAMREDFDFCDAANVRNAVQLSLCRGHTAPLSGRKPFWAPTLEQVDTLLSDEAFKAIVLDVIEIETWGPTEISDAKGHDGAGNPTRPAGETEASKTTPT